MLLTPVLILHVFTALVGLLAGFTAMSLPKGSGLHAAAGNIFFVSMLTASGAGTAVAGFLRPNTGNLMGSTLTLYLVATAWVAARRRHGRSGAFDLGALLFVLAIGVAGLTWGFQAATSPADAKSEYPAVFYFVFGSIALLFAASDIRMIIRGGVFGSKRIARHLVRMCLTLLFATLSSQGRIFPQWARHTSLVHVPTVLVVGMMVFSLYRVSRRRGAQQNQTVSARHGEEILGMVA